jgi:DNA repair protein RecO (recombination protein O)
MPDFNIQAIVLRRSHFGETDNILTLYSRERGRISAIAKGARKAVSRLSGASEVLNHSRFSLASAKTLQVVRQAETVASFSPLREDLNRLANGLYIADLLNAFVVDGDPNPDLFDLLEYSLHLISTVASPNLAARWFELRILDHLGYAPLLTECIYCGSSLVPAARIMTALSASQGGVLCDRHAHPQSHDDQSLLDRKSLHLLHLLYAARNSEELAATNLLNRTDISDRKAASALRRYIRFRNDRELKSLAFLDTVRSGAEDHSH